MARRSRSSCIRWKESPAVGYTTLKSMPRSSRRSYMSRGNIAVEHVLAGRRPERLHPHALAGTLGHRHLERAGHAGRGGVESLHRSLAADATKLLAHHRHVLDPVPVGVDHGMVQARVKSPGVHVTVRGHGEPPRVTVTFLACR